MRKKCAKKTCAIICVRTCGSPVLYNKVRATTFACQSSTKTQNFKNKKSKATMSSSSPSDDKREKNKLYKRISRQKRKNLTEGLDECANLPYQDKIRSGPSFVKSQMRKEEPASKKRKSAVDAEKILFINSSQRVHEKLEHLSVDMDNWAGKQTNTKNARSTKARGKKLQEIQNNILKEVDLKWECNVRYAAPDDWKFGDLKVCKKKNIASQSFLLKLRGHNWFEIKPSTIKGAGLGLFAARRFQAQELIGFYMGQYEPNDERSTGYQLNKINARPNEEAQPPYFGLQFSNDPFYEKDVQKLTKLQAKNLQGKVNIEFGAGYECRTVKRIDKGAEIFVMYEPMKIEKELKDLEDLEEKK